MTKSGRQVKEKKIWEPASPPKRGGRGGGGSRGGRPRGPTLEATHPQPAQKRSKTKLIAAEDIDESETEQQAVINAGYLMERGGGEVELLSSSNSDSSYDVLAVDHI